MVKDFITPAEFIVKLKLANYNISYVVNSNGN